MQKPLSLPGARKGDVRTQFAALCYRIRRGKIEILLITSRGSKRWIVPKGWPMDAMTPGETALREAWEEAGVAGRAWEQNVGVYSYAKGLADMDDLPCIALVYPVEVRTLIEDFPEAGQRTRKWLSRKKAAKLVDEPELSRIIRDFDPRRRQRAP